VATYKLAANFIKCQKFEDTKTDNGLQVALVATLTDKLK
jgi:hypothetical protein